MKILGIALLNLSWIAVGFSSAYKLKTKCVIANELIEMCNLMAVELEFSVNETKKIIDRLNKESTISHLSFLKGLTLEHIDIKTILNDEDNEKINFLFRNLGKTDSQSMLNMINNFKENMLISKNKYEEYYKNHSKLYMAFGIFGAFAVTLVLI